MAIKYTIYTENVNTSWLLEQAAITFPGGCTTFLGEGFWEGKKEASFVLQAIGAEPEQVQRYAETVKTWNNQQSVMITSEQCDVQFV